MTRPPVSSERRTSWVHTNTHRIEGLESQPAPFGRGAERLQATRPTNACGAEKQAELNTAPQHGPGEKVLAAVSIVLCL